MTVKISVKSSLHKKILQALLARKQLSEREMADKRGNWERSDKDFQSAIPKSDNDALRRASRDRGVPQFTTIEVPYSYSMVLAAHTYLATVLLGRSPVLQFSGRHGETEDNVMAVEAIMEYNTTVGAHIVPYYVWLMDSLKYGIGIIQQYWDEEVRTISKIETIPLTIAGVAIPGQDRTIRRVQTISGYKGNKLRAIRPYDYIGDPRVPLSAVDDGEFAGHLQNFSWNELKKKELQGIYMNIDEAKKHLNFQGDKKEQVVGVPPLPSVSQALPQDSMLVGMGQGFEMKVELIPKDWGLGTTEFPEIWKFSVVADRVIIQARPDGYLHGKFGYRIIESEVEGYQLTKRSLFDVARPLNDTLSWLFNSHIYAVRKTLNGDIVYDPSRIVAQDLLRSDEGDPGSRIRLRPEAYGTDVGTAIHTITGGADVTGAHLRDAQIVEQLMQRATGVTDNLMGVLNSGGRKTATEARQSAASSINRLRTLSEYISSMGFSPLSDMMLSTVQQEYDSEQMFRIAGDTFSNAQNFINITPELIAGSYSYIPVDGALPIDRFALVSMWGNLLNQIQRFPQIMQQYDMGKVFEWIGQQGGIKNIKQFKIKTVPDGQLANSIQQGNSVPAGGGAKSPNGGGTGPVIPLPARAPGMDRAG